MSSPSAVTETPQIATEPEAQHADAEAAELAAAPMRALITRLTAILVVLGVLTAAVIAGDVIYLVRNAPAPIPAVANLTITVIARGASGSVVLRTSGTTESFELDSSETGRKRAVTLAAYESVQVEARITSLYISEDEYTATTPTLTCQIIGADGKVLREAATTTEAGTAVCAWANGTKG